MTDAHERETKSVAAHEGRSMSDKLAAHPKFEWMSGMLGYCSISFRYIGPDPGSGSHVLVVVHNCCYVEEWTLGMLAEAAPDLSDPATQGALVASLKATAPDILDIGWHIDAQGWAVTVNDVHHYGDTIGEALALALLDAWGEAEPPYRLHDGPEECWVIDTPSRVRQTRYESRADALAEIARRKKADRDPTSIRSQHEEGSDA